MKLKLFLIKSIDSINSTEAKNRSLKGSYENNSPFGVNIGFKKAGKAISIKLDNTKQINNLEAVVKFVKDIPYDHNNTLVVGEKISNSYMVFADSLNTKGEISKALYSALEMYSKYC